MYNRLHGFVYHVDIEQERNYTLKYVHTPNLNKHEEWRSIVSKVYSPPPYRYQIHFHQPQLRVFTPQDSQHHPT